MSLRNVRSTDQMKSRSRARNPARVGCRTESPHPGRLLPSPCRGRTGTVTILHDVCLDRREATPSAKAVIRGYGCPVNSDDDLGLAGRMTSPSRERCHSLHGCVVHGGPVRRVQIAQQRHLPVHRIRWRRDETPVSDGSRNWASDRDRSHFVASRPVESDRCRHRAAKSRHRRRSEGIRLLQKTAVTHPPPPRPTARSRSRGGAARAKLPAPCS